MFEHGCFVPQVTGANQGIGLEMVRQLCKTFDGHTLLAGTMLITAIISIQLDHNLPVKEVLILQDCRHLDQADTHC